MSDSDPGLGFGTVYHPEPEPTRNGPVTAVTPGHLRGLPRRRRPGMIALAAALIGVGILASAALYHPADHQVPVLLVTIAATSLQRGTLLAPSELTSKLTPGPGQELVPVALKPSALPASGLAPGDQVLAVATPPSGGSGSGAAVLTHPVPAVVEAVGTTTDQNGDDVVDLLVAAGLGPAVAGQAATGQIALVVTHRTGP